MRGLSQNGLADRLSEGGTRVYASAVGGWLKGALPSGETMLRLPSALGVDGHWLLTGEGQMRRIPLTLIQAALDQITAVVDRTREEAASRPATIPVDQLDSLEAHRRILDEEVPLEELDPESSPPGQQTRRRKPSGGKAKGRNAGGK